MEQYLWIIENDITAHKARETYYVLPGTVFVADTKSKASAFLRYADGELTINNQRIDVGDYLPQLLGIIDEVESSKQAYVVITA